MGFRKEDVTQPVFSNPAPQAHGKLDGCCRTPMGEPEAYSRVLPVPWAGGVSDREPTELADLM